VYLLTGIAVDLYSDRRMELLADGAGESAERIFRMSHRSPKELSLPAKRGLCPVSGEDAKGQQ
jgi:hypothetical protein